MEARAFFVLSKLGLNNSRSCYSKIHLTNGNFNEVVGGQMSCITGLLSHETNFHDIKKSIYSVN